MYLFSDLFALFSQDYGSHLVSWHLFSVFLAWFRVSLGVNLVLDQLGIVLLWKGGAPCGRRAESSG